MSHKHVILKRLSFAGISSASAQQTVPITLHHCLSFASFKMPIRYQQSGLQCLVSGGDGIPQHSALRQILSFAV